MRKKKNPVTRKPQGSHFIIAILFCVPAFVSEQFAVVTCGPRCVDVESSAPDMDVGPEVPGQWLI